MVKKRLIKNIQDKGISGAQQTQINELVEKVNQGDNKYMWLDKSNQHILKAFFVGKPETNHLGFFNDVIRCYRGGSRELASEMFITPGQISFKLFDETYYSMDEKARVPREIFIYNREGAIELWSSGEVLVRDPNNFTSKKYVDIVVGDNVHNINQRIDATNTEVATVKTDLGDLGNQVVDNRNETDRVNRLLTSVIEGLKTLRPFNYVGDYVNGTTYNKNDLVSLNNTLYLSKEDNNATTPPGDKWVILQEQVQIDLSNYYNKQEIDSKETALNTRIDTTNTEVARVDSVVNNNSTNIVNLDQRVTTLNNEAVKLTGDQTISGIKTFNSLKTDAGFTLSGTDWNFANKDVGFKQIRKLWMGGAFEMGGHKIENVGAPTANKDAANKQYVDNKFSFTELLSWTGNLSTTNLTWNKASSFSSTGIYEFVIQMKYLGKVFNHSLTMNLDSFGKANVSEVWYFVNNNNSTAIANLNTLTTAYSLVITTAKEVKIIRYGTQHNATDSSIKIWYRKLV